MKLQISFDTNDLQSALDIASKIVDYCDILEVGTLLIYTHGVKSIQAFKESFPRKIIIADCKIVDRPKDAVQTFAQTGADWITVMAGTSPHVIHSACSTAHTLNKKIMLDLLDSPSMAQSALEAKNLGAHALLFHQPADEKDSLTFLDKWDFVKSNASLPIFISAKIKRETIDTILPLNPDGIIIGKSITTADNPAEEARFYYELCSKQ